MLVFFKVIETRLIAYGPLYVKKPPKYWSKLQETFYKARNDMRPAKSLKSKQSKLQNKVSTTKGAFLSLKNYLKPSNPKKALKQAKNSINAQNAV